MDDVALFEAWRGGDRAAGDALLARHFDTLYGFFQRRVAGDVSDLVQRTFLGLVEGKDRVRGDASIRTYLFVIARRELWAHYARREREGAPDFGVSSIEDLAPSPSSILRRRDAGERLVGALRRIPVDAQLVVELYYWEALAAPDVARVLEIPEGTVRSRLRRAIEALRTELGPDDPGIPAEDEAFAAWARELKPAR